jgi:hypothetical protein
MIGLFEVTYPSTLVLTNLQCVVYKYRSVRVTALGPTQTPIQRVLVALPPPPPGGGGGGVKRPER